MSNREVGEGINTLIHYLQVLATVYPITEDLNTCQNNILSSQ